MSKALWVLYAVFFPFPFHHSWKLIFWIFYALCVENYSCTKLHEVRKADLIFEHRRTNYVIMSITQGCGSRRLQKKCRIKFTLPRPYNPVKQKEYNSHLKFSFKIDKLDSLRPEKVYIKIGRELEYKDYVTIWQLCSCPVTCRWVTFGQP